MDGLWYYVMGPDLEILLYEDDKINNIQPNIGFWKVKKARK